MGVSTADVWLGDLHQGLTEQYGSAHGDLVFARYAEAFPQTYCETVSTRQTLADIAVLENALPSSGSPTLRLPHLWVHGAEGTRLA